MRAASPPSARVLLAAQGWCQPEVLEALGDLAAERAPLLGRLRELGVGEDRLGELDGLLRLQERIPTVDIIRLLEDAPSPGQRLFLGRHRASGAEALVLVAPWSDPAQLRRFHREVRSLGALRHPLVAGLLDAGEHRGVCWVAVERVAGRSLADLLGSEQGLREAEALALVRRLAGALSALASVGVLHRGVSPAVLRVGADGETARLIDAGLMRALCGMRKQAELDSSDYLAPEQVRGQTVGERALVYSIGAILFHALAGAPPFVGSSVELVRKAHLFEAAPDLGCLLPDLHEQTRRIVATALRKPPADRYRSLDDLAGACAQALAALGAAPADAAPVAIAAPEDPTPATGAVPVLDDPFAAADAAAPVEARAAEVTSRILAKHAALKAERSLVAPPRSRQVVSESFLSRTAPVTRVDVVMGVIVANGWVAAERQRELREFFRAHASSLALRMRGGVSQLLVTRGILDADQARELELTLADQAPFPHYRIGRLLGTGMLGRTYAALDIASGSEVAFKVFRVDGEERRRRFLDEHSSIARLSHPGVAQALACGADGEACFAASALVPGLPLLALLGDERVAPEAWALRVSQQVAEALGYVHARTAQGHGGLSMGNVRLQRVADEPRMFPPGDRAVVCDFGFASLAEVRGGDAALLAPELLRGEPGDERSDIFALGALLHRVLTGRAPTPHEAAAGADPGLLVPGLHELTREIVTMAVRPDPEQRQADLDVLVAMLGQAARDVAQEYAHEPQIVRQAAAAPPESTRVLRRHHAPGPLGSDAVRQPGPAGRAGERRFRGDADFPQT